nr:uncharacterized protein LOC106025075 [Cavia porcellus]
MVGAGRGARVTPNSWQRARRPPSTPGRGSSRRRAPRRGLLAGCRLARAAQPRPGPGPGPAAGPGLAALPGTHPSHSHVLQAAHLSHRCPLLGPTGHRPAPWSLLRAPPRPASGVQAGGQDGDTRGPGPPYSDLPSELPSRVASQRRSLLGHEPRRRHHRKGLEGSRPAGGLTQSHHRWLSGGAHRAGRGRARGRELGFSGEAGRAEVQARRRGFPGARPAAQAQAPAETAVCSGTPGSRSRQRRRGPECAAGGEGALWPASAGLGSAMVALALPPASKERRASLHEERSGPAHTGLTRGERKAPRGLSTRPRVSVSLCYFGLPWSLRSVEIQPPFWMCNVCEQLRLKMTFCIGSC